MSPVFSKKKEEKFKFREQLNRIPNYTGCRDSDGLQQNLMASGAMVG